jgi:hypothetical protein
MGKPREKVPVTSVSIQAQMVLVVDTVSDSKCPGMVDDRRSLRKQFRAPQGANSDATTNSMSYHSPAPTILQRWRMVGAGVVRLVSERVLTGLTRL